MARGDNVQGVGTGQKRTIAWDRWGPDAKQRRFKVVKDSRRTRTVSEEGGWSTRSGGGRGRVANKDRIRRGQR